MALTRLAHHIIRTHFIDKPKGLAIDGTCGNGHDTEFLARLGFEHVIGFDIQETAIQNTQIRLDNANLVNVTLRQQGHQFIGQHIQKKLDCAMFNFGYLPKADKSITTLSDTSVIALASTLTLLASHGLLCLICYPGHEEGALETQAIQTWLTTLNKRWQITEHVSKSPKPEAPVMYIITRNGNEIT